MHTITHKNEALYRTAIAEVCSKYTAPIFADIGGWDGKYSVQIAKIVKAKKIICVDHDKTALTKAAKRGCQTILTDLNQPIDMPSNSVDLIVNNNVIEHIAKTDTLVAETYRILKPNGIAVWCTPNLASWHNIFSLVLGYQPFSSQVSDKIFVGNPLHPDYKKSIHEEQAHLRLFTHRSLSDLLEYHKFKVIKRQGIGYYPFSETLANCLAHLDPIHAAYVGVITQKLK
jgi:ubiquinone/menaquinone biosynthesis C-methylase UbiE